MKKLVLLFVITLLGVNTLFAQVPTQNGNSENNYESKTLFGLNLYLDKGIQPSTALTDASFGLPIENSYGYGLIIQQKIQKHIKLFFDFNNHNYNMFLASMGSTVGSSWTAAEGATHWDEVAAAQTLRVNDLPTDVHFDMQTTGFRLGMKYLFSNKKVQPWAGAGYGFYRWRANYYNENKEKTYGGDDGYVFGPSLLGGVDFVIFQGVVISAFIDLLSPIASYTIEGLFYPQWDITDWSSPVFGQYKFGVTLSMAP